MSLNVKWILFLERPGGRDPRVVRTLRFLGRKGFLHCELPTTSPGLTLDEVLWTCEHVAPELFEVVPAAVLRFPRSLPGERPLDLERVVSHLRSGELEGPAYRGHPYEALKYWAKVPTRDRRLSKFRKVVVRLPAAAADRLGEAARARGLTTDQVVRFALDDYLA